MESKESPASFIGSPGCLGGIKPRNCRTSQPNSNHTNELALPLSLSSKLQPLPVAGSKQDVNDPKGCSTGNHDGLRCVSVFPVPFSKHIHITPTHSHSAKSESKGDAAENNCAKNLLEYPVVLHTNKLETGPSQDPQPASIQVLPLNLWGAAVYATHKHCTHTFTGYCPKSKQDD